MTLLDLYWTEPLPPQKHFCVLGKTTGTRIPHPWRVSKSCFLQIHVPRIGTGRGSGVGDLLVLPGVPPGTLLSSSSSRQASRPSSLKCPSFTVMITLYISL